MSSLTRLCKAVLILLLTTEVHAKSATEVFESVSGSVVVVYGNDAKGKHKSLGSGVVLPGGAVVTNCHVIEKSENFVVKYQQQEYPATLKHTDHDRDVCSLTAEGLKAPAAQPGTTKTLKVGQRVYAIGAPRGLELTLSEGIVSSLREVEGGQYIQTSAPISPGSSGGGLFDEEGRLIGLPTFYLTEGQQLNFAVPVEWVKELPQRQVTTQKTGIATLAWLTKAIELENKKDWPAMIQHAQSWANNSPRESQAWHILGVAYGHTDQTAKTIEAYQQALRINPEFAEAWSNLGVVYGETGQITKAVEAYQQALRINPEYAKAWYNLGIAYGKTGQVAKEIEAYQQTLRINPEFAEAWSNLGVTYGEAGQTIKEIEAYQQALRINPEDVDVWYNLGVTYRKAGQTTKAIEAYRLALRINPEYAEAWYNLGIAYKIDGQHSRVMDVYRQLKVVSPQYADEFFTKVVLP